jgi:SAM-dependent methyltransferase
MSSTYDQQYFQGCGAKGNYSDYVADARGPSEHLAETLFRRFRPASALDVGCAVGYTTKRLRQFGVEAWGYDISNWAVDTADVPYIQVFDFASKWIPAQFDLVYSYDVVEHIPEQQLEFAVRNMWSACRKDLLIVPALYPEGTTHDPHEPTHLIFHAREWWLQFFVERCGLPYDPEASDMLAAEEHSKVFQYSDRIFVFSRFRERVPPATS